MTKLTPTARRSIGMDVPRFRERSPRAMAGWPDPRWIAAVTAAVIVILGVAGASVGAEPSNSPFHLENELTIPAFYSALLLIGGGLCALLAARRRLHGQYVVWLGLGLLLLVMGVDEVAQIHERLERHTGIDWEVLYMPLALLGGVAWLRIVLRLGGWPRVLMIAGAGAWVAAQAFEFLEWDGDTRVSAFEPMMISEEVLEMTGSALFLIALYTVVKRASEMRANSSRP